MFRGDIVKDDLEKYAEKTEQGASSSHMKTTTVLDFIPSLPDCFGQARDAVGAYTQVKMKDARELLHLSDEDFPQIWIRLPKAWRPQLLGPN